MPSLKGKAKNAEGKQAPVARKKPEKNGFLPKSLSAEFVQESEDENSNSDGNSDDESLPEVPANVIVPAKDRFPAPDGSESSSEDESESEEESDSEEESESEGSEDEDNEEEDISKSQAPNILRSVKTVAGEPTSTVSQKPREYKAPAGFSSESIHDGAEVAGMFKKSELEGKQIWYFTAPASVPMTSITQMLLLSGKTVEAGCFHDEKNYVFVEDEAEDKTRSNVMVPNASHGGYKSVSKPIDKILHLKQSINLPGINGNAPSSKATVPAIKPIRAQPRGMRMRFLPYGFGEGEPGRLGEESASDEEMEDVPKQFRKPASISSSDSESDEEMTEAAPLPSRPTTTKPKRPPKEDSSAKSTQNFKLKRKLGEGSEKKEKNSSSKSTQICEEKQLKRLKTKKTDPQKNTADKLSALTNAHISSTPIPLPKTTKSLKPDDAVVPPITKDSLARAKILKNRNLLK